MLFPFFSKPHIFRVNPAEEEVHQISEPGFLGCTYLSLPGKQQITKPVLIYPHFRPLSTTYART